MPERAAALLGVLLFCFQLGGAYILGNAAAASSCPHTRIWLSSVSGSSAQAAAQADGESVVTSPAPAGDDGDAIWQCPGTVDGIALTPPQPCRLPAVSAPWMPEPVWNSFAETLPAIPQGHLLARFQPPEALT